MPPTVTAKSAWFSTINWAQAVAALAAVTALFGLPIDPETQVKILAGVTLLVNFFTWVRRTWFNNTVSPTLAGETVTIKKG